MTLPNFNILSMLIVICKNYFMFILIDNIIELTVKLFQSKFSNFRFLQHVPLTKNKKKVILQKKRTQTLKTFFIIFQRKLFRTKVIKVIIENIKCLIFFGSFFSAKIPRKIFFKNNLNRP